MKTKLFLMLILIVLIAGCSENKVTGNLELKTKSEKQDLSQIKVIGTRIGEIPPGFTVVTTEGKVIRLSDLLAQKNPVIIYFMATWCPYCAEDYSALSKIYNNYENNLTFISISLDLSEDVLELAEYKKKYPQLNGMHFAPGQEQILIDYGITKTTTKYAIGKNGTIAYRTIGAFNEEEWGQMLDALMKS
ncbi:TlpA family protein disulfide reductase [Candidatus Woesearchaeota archaeon]|nr:TlpA family protein disulfide reductase [Candidatus Woesearchaeota archaeon]